MDLALLDRPIEDGDRTQPCFESGGRPRPMSGTMGRLVDSVFATKDHRIFHQAMDEACNFLTVDGSVRPARRRDLALTILRHARAGVRDPHRLAVKGIVGVV